MRLCANRMPIVIIFGARRFRLPKFERQRTGPHVLQVIGLIPQLRAFRRVKKIECRQIFQILSRIDGRQN